MSTQPITLIEAITQALAYEMKHDNAVVVLGEDVGVNGGVFRATAGLQQQFGDQRDGGVCGAHARPSRAMAASRWASTSAGMSP